MSSTLLSGTVIRSRVVMSTPEDSGLSTVSVDDVTISGNGSESLPIQIKQSYQDSLAADFSARVLKILTEHTSINGGDTNSFSFSQILNFSVEVINAINLFSEGFATLNGVLGVTVLSDNGPISLDAEIGQGIVITKLPSTDNTVTSVLVRDASGNIRVRTIPVNIATFAAYRSGRYYSANENATAVTNTFLAANNIRAFPWFVRTSITITEIISEVSTFSALTTYRVGLYTDNAGYPGNLVTGSDVGTYDSASNGVKTSGAVSITLSAGLYWIAVNSNGAATLRSLAQGSISYILGMTSTLGSGAAHTVYAGVLAYGAMPATYPAAQATTAISPYLIAFKV